MRRNTFIVQSRLRTYMKKYTSNEYILNTCMRASGQIVGFICTDDKNFYKADRQFIKKLKQIPNERIDNFALSMQHEYVGKEVKRIIKSVKDDLRSMA